LTRRSSACRRTRHISPDAAGSLGINVTPLESDHVLQDLVLTLHHTLTHTFTHTNAIKIIENHGGIAYVNQVVLASPGK
jgi:hypothetical protein